MTTDETKTMDIQPDGVPAVTPGIGLIHDSDTSFVDTWLNDIALRQRLAFSRGARWYTRARLDALPADSMLCAASRWDADLALLRVRGLVVRVRIDSDDECFAEVYADRYSAGDFEAVLAQVRGWLEPRREDDPGCVEVRFRYRGRHNAASSGRGIEAPSWADIRMNYAMDVTQAIDRAASPSFVPGEGGRLLLLHGTPGTGKTYVIRALAREWRGWCRAEYVADPETFFNDANYMMDVLLDSRENDKESKTWRLLILEDAGEMLARDAKVREGQGLSRLLNIGEGLIGQGLRVLTLISTNEKLESLNDAVSRPGRTAVEIEFTPLSIEECRAWLGVNGKSDHEVTRPLTLAELYAVRNGARITAHKSSSPIGFRRN